MTVSDMHVLRLDAAIHVIGAIALKFHLNGGVIDAMAGLQFRCNAFQNALTTADGFFLDHDMDAGCNHTCANRPHVQIVNTAYAGDGADVLFNCPHINSGWRAF